MEFCACYREKLRNRPVAPQKPEENHGEQRLLRPVRLRLTLRWTLRRSQSESQTHEDPARIIISRTRVCRQRVRWPAFAIQRGSMRYAFGDGLLRARADPDYVTRGREREIVLCTQLRPERNDVPAEHYKGQVTILGSYTFASSVNSCDSNTGFTNSSHRSSPRASAV